MEAEDVNVQMFWPFRANNMKEHRGTHIGIDLVSPFRVFLTTANKLYKATKIPNWVSVVTK